MSTGSRLPIAGMLFGLSAITGCGETIRVPENASTAAHTEPVATPPPEPVAMPQAPPQPAQQPKVESDEGIPDAPVKALAGGDIRILLKSLPLTDDRLDFEAIDRFALLYAPFSSNKPLLRSIRGSCREARSLLQNEVSVISLSESTGPNQIELLVKPPDANHGWRYLPFLMVSSSALTYVNNAVLALRSDLRKELTPEAEQLFRDQEDIFNRQLTILRNLTDRFRKRSQR